MSVEPSLEFVDTNILVYAHDDSNGEKYTAANQLLKKIWDTRSGCLSVQILQEFYVTVTRKAARPISLQLAAEILHDLSFWPVHSPTAEDVLGAINLQQQYQISFWDAMAIHSAICMGCKVFWSEDLAHGQVFRGVVVRNPFHQQD